MAGPIPRDSEPEIPVDLIQAGTVLAILEAQDPERDPVPLNATSHAFVDLPTPVEDERALRIGCLSVAERVLRLLGTAARRASAENPECRELVIARTDSEAHPPALDEPVLELLEHRFGLFSRSAGPTRAAARLLAGDLYRWVGTCAGEAERFGLRLESKDGSLRIRCPRRRGS